VTAVWYYQIQGFELGPVPLIEMQRLIHKGRIVPETLVRRDSGDWICAEQAAGLFAEEGRTSPWHTVLLERFAVVGIPLGVALLPWGRLAASVGIVILAPFAVALVRLLLDVARDLRAIRRKLTAR
jgi:hypothetical protein